MSDPQSKITTLATIAPTITATSPSQFRQQIENIQDFARRVHIDYSDGVFAPTKLVPLTDVWWPIGMMADLHIMALKPLDLIDETVSLQPHLVVVHAESEGWETFLQELAGLGIKRGIALLQETPISAVEHILGEIDHLLVFSGHLGFHGGTADLSLLAKVREAREKFPDIEIGWDGGINDQNAPELIKAGVNVLNTGSFIQGAPDPEAAFDKITRL